MQKITPSLWFDHTAGEAVGFYTSVFPDARRLTTSHYPTEGLLAFQRELAGKELAIDFELSGQRFTAINAGPQFRVNPAISFMLNFDASRGDDARSHLDRLWDKLADGGTALMELGEYPFSQRYGWMQDRYGVSWQLILTDPSGESRPFIVPSLMFGSANVNRAKEAIDYYTSVFGDSRLGTMAPYVEATGPAAEGSVMYADFTVAGQWFAAMDAGGDQDFTFNEAVSLQVMCADQAEIDYFWQKLSHVPGSEQCGWCKDQFGVSWQVLPANLPELMARPGAFEALMEMKKIQIDGF